MKLLNKTGRYYLLGLVGVMLVGGIIFYFLLIRSLNHFETENLLNSKDIVIEKLNKNLSQNP
ncbi:MAG: hypothetical protein LH629_13255, partial [Ignavibacteria bacterium]|nr:hypothetical protein [Ignavibacteria bacterium]